MTTFHKYTVLLKKINCIFQKSRLHITLLFPYNYQKPFSFGNHCLFNTCRLYFPVYFGEHLIFLLYIFGGGALYIYKKLSSFFHIILGSTGYFEKSPIPTILLWGALYIYEKLSSFTSLSCMNKVKKKLPQSTNKIFPPPQRNFGLFSNPFSTYCT